MSKIIYIPRTASVRIL